MVYYYINSLYIIISIYYFINIYTSQSKQLGKILLITPRSINTKPNKVEEALSPNQSETNKNATR